MSFSVTFRRAAGGVTVVAPSGELDAHTAPEFEAALAHALDDGESRLVVDGVALSYVSSAGVGVLMATLDPARDAGGDLKVAALAPHVREVLDLLGVPDVLDVTDSVAEAVQRFADGDDVAAPGIAQGP